ncbi:MAG TPA: pyrroline-5-carboxylate reductase dimerization domain-containing protein [Gammaproteobacteria bacterium]|nr:pyrroline-5-carboxylate reductase dimerization domain-containing protein [Gammaproteobacteria bacterium]
MIVIIGFGSMGQALAHGWKSSFSVAVVHKSTTLSEFTDIDGINNIKKSEENTYILAVKPHDIPGTCQQLKKHLHPNNWVMSVAAGISHQQLTQELNHSKVLRSMPNLAVQDKKGLTAIFSPQVTPQEQRPIENLWNDIGECFWVNSEHDFHLFTAVVGSGPAYFIAFASALETSLQELGLDKASSEKWSKASLQAASTLSEAAPLSEIIQHIQSPQGTTEAALNSWQDTLIKTMLTQMIMAAKTRSLEIGNSFK